jgi:hypothetical protein
MIKLGKFAYHTSMLYNQPEAFKHLCLIVQLSYRMGSNQCSKSFNAISTDVHLIDIILPTPGEEKLNTLSEQLWKAVEDGKTILIAFQVKQVVYTKEHDETGVS